MKKFIVISILIIGSLSFLNAQNRQAVKELNEMEWKTFKEYIRASETYIPDTNIDVKFYYISLLVAIDSTYISGGAECNFVPTVENLGEITLSLHKSLTVTGVYGQTDSYTRVGDSILISLDGTYGPSDLVNVVVKYEGIPVMAGGYKGLRYETHHGDEPIIATLSTPYLAHYWYPCKDGPSDKADSVYVSITIPDQEINGVEVMGVSNGILDSVIDNGNTKTFNWIHRYPVVPYYVMIAISNYVKFTEDYTGIYGEQYPLDYYVFQQDLEEAQQGVEDLPIALDVFSEKFGEYPFSDEKYGMTQLGYYGAIENQTNTIQNTLKPSWFYISVHELGHMWFGDMITCENWHHGWLNEGFASYSEAVYEEAVNGYDAYLSYVQGYEYWSGGTLYLENANDTFNIFQGIIYDKGAYTLHMLRGVLGHEVFWDGIYAYSTDPDLMYGQAVTEDLQEVLEDVSGEDLEYFFEQWVYDEYYPQYLYNFENKADSFAFVIWQVQEQSGRRPLFIMPMDVKLTFASGNDTILRIWNDEIYQVYTFPGDDPVVSMLPDPEKYILCQKTFSPGTPVDINESIHKEDLFINIYPNPVGSVATVEILKPVDNAVLSVYNIDGRLFARLPNLSTGIYSLPMNSYPPGIYIYVLDEGDRFISSGKVIVK